MAKQNYATRPMNRFVSSRAGKFAALAALATFSLTACGSDPTSASEPAGAEPGSSANASGLACPAGKLSAEGSSAQANAITEVIADYNAECGDKATIEYNPTGSGAGIKSFYNGLVDFAGSDSALKTEEVDGVVEADKAKERCQNNPAWNLPMVVGPIAFAYNIDGVDKLVLNAEVLAGDLQRHHQDLERPEDRQAQLRTPSCRARTSRCSSAPTSPAPPRTPRSSSPRPATAPGRTSRPRPGPAPARARTSPPASPRRAPSTKNSITYIEWSYAKDNNLTMAQLDSGNGPVELTGDSVAKAVVGGQGQGHRQRPEP